MITLLADLFSKNSKMNSAKEIKTLKRQGSIFQKKEKLENYYPNHGPEEF